MILTNNSWLRMLFYRKELYFRVKEQHSKQTVGKTCVLETRFTFLKQEHDS